MENSHLLFFLSISFFFFISSTHAVVSNNFIATSTNSVCFSAPYDPATCLSWKTDSVNITFTAVAPPIPQQPSVVVGWIGWGITQLSCGSMFPSSVWMAIKGPNGVVLEDRAATAHVIPLCQKSQLSYVTESHVDPDGSFTITWTRPLIAPKSSGQPSILPGNVTLIGAIFFGSLDLRPCEQTGIPAHQSFVTFTADLLGSTKKTDNNEQHNTALVNVQTPQAPPTPPAGLIATFPVCTSYSNLAHLTPTGQERFYGESSLLALLPGVSTLDPVGRKIYSLLMSTDGSLFDLISLNVDSGVRGKTCSTTFPVPVSYALQNLNIAFDSNNKTVIVAGCTDVECAGYVQVSQINPETCESRSILKVATDPSIYNSQGGGAFDAKTNTFIMSVMQIVGKASSGPVLISVDMVLGKVLHTFVEANSTLVSVTSDGLGRFLGVSVLPDLRVALTTIDTVKNKITIAPPVPNCVQALPGMSALEKQETGDDIFYFFTQDGGLGAARLIGVFAANGTIASTGTLPGDVSLLPTSFFMLN
jgi:hypothetical protein